MCIFQKADFSRVEGRPVRFLIGKTESRSGGGGSIEWVAAWLAMRNV